MPDYRVVTACRLCDSTDLTEALNLGETPLANELDGTELFPLVVNRCGSCGHHQLSIAVSPERLWGPSYPYQSGTSPVFREHLSKLADEVAGLKPSGRVIEIASNDGTFCEMLANRGLDVIGVDPSGRAEEDQYMPGGGSMVLLDESWPSAVIPPGDADVILALNVFAHVDDLHSFTAAVKEALAPDGVFIVEVGYLPYVTERGLFDVMYHEHMSYFGAVPLKRFFTKHGMSMTRWVTHDSQGGSIRCYVRHSGADPNRLAEDDGNNEVVSLRPIIDSHTDALQAALSKLAARGETVAIYGAPAKLTTLLYATGLQDFPFACVFDDNPKKIGRTTPGNHIPIVSSAELLERNVDTLLVASWNFFDDIKRKVRKAGFKGGLINPMGDE